MHSISVYAYEAAIVAVAAIAWFALLRKDQRTYAVATNLRGQQLQEANWAYVLVAIILVAGTVAFLLYRSTDAVVVCEKNERQIQTALTGYIANVGSYPAAAAIQVKAVNGATAGTFSNPTNIASDFLGQQPTDPVNTAGFYTFTYVKETAGVPASYLITCPGIHSQADLGNMPGAAAETSGKITLNNSSGFNAI